MSRLLTIYRNDFKNSQDYPNESFFESVILSQLGFDEKDMESINEVTVKVEEIVETD